MSRAEQETRSHARLAAAECLFPGTRVLDRPGLDSAKDGWELSSRVKRLRGMYPRLGEGGSWGGWGKLAEVACSIDDCSGDLVM